MATLGCIRSGVPVAELLARCGLSATRGKRGWRLALPAARNLGVMAGDEKGFLSFRAVLPRRWVASEQIGRLLELNGQLPGGARFALEGHSRRLLILAEIPCEGSVQGDDAEVVCCRINDACAGITTALELLESVRAGSGQEAQPVSAPESLTNDHVQRQSTDGLPASSSSQGRSSQLPEIELEFGSDFAGNENAAEDGWGARAEALHARCLEAGWPVNPRRNGALSVALEVPEGPCAGRFEALGAEAVRLRSDPCWPPAGDTVCQQAIEYLLLRASAVLRIAAAVRMAEPGSGARGPYMWQVRWESLPEAAELGHALAALSVACRLTVREVEALGDPRIARQYLALQQWPAGRS